LALESELQDLDIIPQGITVGIQNRVPAGPQYLRGQQLISDESSELTHDSEISNADTLSDFNPFAPVTDTKDPSEIFEFGGRRTHAKYKYAGNQKKAVRKVLIKKRRGYVFVFFVVFLCEMYF